MRKLGTLGFALACLMALSGCESGATSKAGGDVRPSGFLSDYGKMRRGGEGEAISVYWNETADFKAYNKILIEPVTIWLDPTSELSETPAEDRQNLANSFHAVLQETLSEDYEIVQVPGPGTIRLRVALTEAVASSPTMDTISTYIPQARLLSGIATIGSDTAAFVGEATAEGEARDAVSGELLAAGVDRRAGSKALDRDTLSSWSDVEAAFKAWAEQFRDNLRERRG